MADTLEGSKCSGEFENLGILSRKKCQHDLNAIEVCLEQLATPLSGTRSSLFPNEIGLHQGFTQFNL